MPLLSRRQVLAAGVLPLAPCARAADDAFPARPIRIIVPFAPGGGTDVLARAMARGMNHAFNVPVLVENKPGANGVIGAQAVAQAPADGYTLLLTIASHAIAPAVYKKLPYDTLADFRPVSLLATYPYLFTVPESMPVANFKEFIAYAKAKKGALSYASSGTGSGPHLGMELIKAATGIEMQHVPYKGASAASADLLSGQVDAMLNNLLAASAFIKAKRLKVLALSGAQRSAAFPGTPTIRELGYPTVNIDGWYGMFAPAKTPDAVIARFSEAIKATLSDKELVERLSTDAAIPIASPPEVLGKFLEAEVARWQQVVKTAHISLD